MSTFKDEQLNELIELVDKAAKNGRCKLEYYMNDEVKPVPTMKNHDIEKVPAVLEEIRQGHDFAREIKNTREMALEEIKRAYASCAHWASNPPKRQDKISRTVHKTFEAGETGSWFGREIPALIVTSSSGNIVFALPHHVVAKKFSLIDQIQKSEGSYQVETILTVYDFLKALKDHLEKRSCRKRL
jgi:hypothetical protein